MSISQAGSEKRNSGLKAVETVAAALERAENAAELNPFAVLDTEGALATARALDRLSAKARGPLHGMAVTVKDLFNVSGMPTRAGTRAPLPDIRPEEAPVVTRLRDSGAVIIGKTNMHEIALGLTGENQWTGDVKNPRDSARMAGGSSSGSAVAVAVGACRVSIGTDTAGSIRLPPAFCGVIGFKPSYGLVPLKGALPLSPTTDHVGVIARNLADVQTVFEMLTARSCLVRAPSEMPVPRFVVPSKYLDGKLSIDVRVAFERLLEEIRASGAEVVEHNPGEIELAARIQSPLGWTEAALVHRRSLEAGADGFSDQVRVALNVGLGTRAVDYLEARRVRGVVREGLETCFFSSGADAMLLPTAPVPAPRRGTPEVELEWGTVAFRDAVLPLLAPFSIAGVPALSLPFAETQGLALGVQVVTRRGHDAQALEIGRWLEALGVMEPSMHDEASSENES